MTASSTSQSWIALAVSLRLAAPRTASQSSSATGTAPSSRPKRSMSAWCRTRWQWEILTATASRISLSEARTPSCASCWVWATELLQRSPIMQLVPGGDIFSACNDVDVADFNRDGLQDLVVPLGNGRGNAILIVNGNRTLHPQACYL